MNSCPASSMLVGRELGDFTEPIAIAAGVSRRNQVRGKGHDKYQGADS